ncbi:MAG: putative bifunctional diguanylate cyclase/phosphodiesterase, partial [Pseudomonadales bacterium]
IQASLLAPAVANLGGPVGTRFANDVSRATEQLRSALSDRQSTVPLEDAVQQLQSAQASVAAELRSNIGQGKDSAAQVLSVLVVTVLASLAGMTLVLRRPRAQSVSRPWPSSNVDAQLFEHAPVPIVYSDHHDIILAANASYLRMSGYEEQDTIGQSLFFDGAGRQDEQFFAGMHEQLHQHGRWSGELWMRSKNGEAYPNKVVRLAVCDGGSRVAGYLTVSAESLQSNEQQRLMMWQAHHDPLTKLPNKIMLDERLSRAVLQDDAQGVLITLDLDRFKEVNDSIGPAMGDQVLMDVGMRLAMGADTSDTVARVGGDTFVLLSRSDDPEARAEALCTEIRKAFAEPFRVENKEIHLHSSVGVVLFPKDGLNGADLLQKADAARGEIKRAGGNDIGYFEQEINERAERRMALQTALRGAIVGEQLQLALQPIVALSGHKLLGAEALLRWEHPELGFVSPAEFIPIAETSGLIIEIGLWVVREAQRLRDVLAAEGLQDLRLSLNVSALQIQSLENSHFLLDLLEGHGAERLTLEITESAIIDHSDNAKWFLERARRLGCQVALDDFGTGFSSLAYLREFNFDVLKIDKAFIDRLDSTRDLGLVASIISMGKILGMHVVAEGVEEPEQLDQLRRIGCHFVQGYLFSKPLPFAQFVTYAKQAEQEILRAGTQSANDPVSEPVAVELEPSKSA